MTHTNIDQLHPRLQLINSDGTPTHFFLRWLQATWERTGGPDDAINEIQNGELAEVGVTDTALQVTKVDLAGLGNEVDMASDSRLGFLYDNRFVTREISADHTTTGHEEIICTAAVTITLNTTARVGERVYIKRTNGKVTIVGTIDNKTNLIIHQNNAVVTLVFTESGWWIL